MKIKNWSVELDTTLDDKLIVEGKLRELMRQVQDKRKELGSCDSIRKSPWFCLKYLRCKPKLKRQVLADQIIVRSEFAAQLM